MARHSQNIDKKLVEMGKKLLTKTTMGISNFSVRSVCVSCGVNLGMFCYYFKTKKNFMKVLFKSLISDLQNQLKKEFEKTDLPEQRLRNVLLLSTKLIYKNRNVAASIMKDVNFHDKFYMKLMKETHISLINFYREIIDDCKTSGVLDKRIDTNILFAVMSGSVATFSKNVFFENYNDKEFEKKINLILDLLMEKFK